MRGQPLERVSCTRLLLCASSIYKYIRTYTCAVTKVPPQAAGVTPKAAILSMLREKPPLPITMEDVKCAKAVAKSRARAGRAPIADDLLSADQLQAQAKAACAKAAKAARTAKKLKEQAETLRAAQGVALKRAAACDAAAGSPGCKRSCRRPVPKPEEPVQPGEGTEPAGKAMKARLDPDVTGFAQLRVIAANKPERTYLTGVLGGARHLIVEVSASMSPRHGLIIQQIKQQVEAQGLSKRQAVELRAQLLVSRE